MTPNSPLEITMEGRNKGTKFVLEYRTLVTDQGMVY